MIKDKETNREEIRNAMKFYDIVKDVEKCSVTTELGRGCPKCGSHNYESIGSGGRYSRFGFRKETACKCKDCGWHYVIIGG